MPPSSSTVSAIDDRRSGRELELCQWETFEASCGHEDDHQSNESSSSSSSGDHHRHSRVIVVDSARYGLMKIGRCATKDYGSMGCSANVIDQLDEICSGRRQCRFVVPDERIRATRPCPKEFAPYLEVSYHCIDGTHSDYIRL